jgi:hypothetical protein
MGIVLNGMEYRTKALIQRHFGTNRYYHDYHYSKTHPEPDNWEKAALILNDIKTMLLKLIPTKKGDH